MRDDGDQSKKSNEDSKRLLATEHKLLEKRGASLRTLTTDVVQCKMKTRAPRDCCDGSAGFRGRSRRCARCFCWRGQHRINSLLHSCTLTGAFRQLLWSWPRCRSQIPSLTSPTLGSLRIGFVVSNCAMIWMTKCLAVHGIDTTTKNESHIKLWVNIFHKCSTWGLRQEEPASTLDSHLPQSSHIGPSTRKPHGSTDGIPSMSLSVETLVFSVSKGRSARRCQHISLAWLERGLNVVCGLVSLRALVRPKVGVYVQNK